MSLGTRRLLFSLGLPFLFSHKTTLALISNPLFFLYSLQPLLSNPVTLVTDFFCSTYESYVDTYTEIQVGRVLWRWPSPTSCWKQGWCQVGHGLFSWILKISKNGNSTAALGDTTFYQTLALAKIVIINSSFLFPGNKSDLSDLREVQLEEAQSLAERYDNIICAIETSAKDSSNVEEAFVKMATELMMRHGGPMFSEKNTDSIKLDSKDVVEGWGCGCWYELGEIRLYWNLDGALPLMLSSTVAIFSSFCETSRFVEVS